jgi:hypothetical protein
MFDTGFWRLATFSYLLSIHQLSEQ